MRQTVMFRPVNIKRVQPQNHNRFSSHASRAGVLAQNRAVQKSIWPRSTRELPVEFMAHMATALTFVDLPAYDDIDLPQVVDAKPRSY